VCVGGEVLCVVASVGCIAHARWRTATDCLVISGYFRVPERCGGVLEDITLTPPDNRP